MNSGKWRYEKGSGIVGKSGDWHFKEFIFLAAVVADDKYLVIHFVTFIRNSSHEVLCSVEMRAWLLHNSLCNRLSACALVPLSSLLWVDADTEFSLFFLRLCRPFAAHWWTARVSVSSRARFTYEHVTSANMAGWLTVRTFVLVGFLGVSLLTV